MAFPARRGRVAVVFRDITERKEAETERARTTRDLQRSNEELQRFVVAASADLQEPLRTVISFVRLLERECGGRLGENADEYIRFIVAGGLRMERLIDGLLQLSGVGTAALPFATTDANEVVAGVLRSMEAPIREADATVSVEDLPTVTADPAQLAQVFEILVGNAVEYARPGVTPEVRISARRADPLWWFAVRDNGMGSSPRTSTWSSRSLGGSTPVTSTRGRGSAWPSRGGSSTATAARSGPNRRRARARPSSLPSPPPEVAQRTGGPAIVHD
jgi:light-regulated signal transduction histidine kinase (bacteriophytochrome)